jgi:hypothetical protein
VPQLANMVLFALYDDLRHAVRLIAANKTISLAVFLSLTIGVGASASMFGAVDALLFRPLPVPQTGRIVRITSVTRDIPLGGISYPDFDDLRKRSTVFEGFAIAQEVGAAVSTQSDGRRGSRSVWLSTRISCGRWGFNPSWAVAFGRKKMLCRAAMRSR